MIAAYSANARLQAILKLLLSLLVLQLATAWSPRVDGLAGIANYAPLHTALEVWAIVVSSLVFSIGWSVYQKEASANLMLLACGFAGVAWLDLMHTLSYQGMPAWVTPSSAEKAINFWLMARAMAVLALAAVAWLPAWRLSNNRVRWLMLSSVGAVVLTVAWLVLWHSDYLPRTFIQGQGLTAFKKNSEYLLAAADVLLAISFFRQMRSRKSYDVAGLFAAAATMAMSEMFFTLYADVTDIFNLLGHLYKVIAYWLIYQAVFKNGIELPYQQLYQANQALKISEAKFQAIIEASPLAYALLDAQQRIRYLNPAFVNTFGYTGADLSSWQDWWLKALPNSRSREICLDNWQQIQHVHDGIQGSVPMELEVCCKDGAKRTVLLNAAWLGPDFAGHQIVILEDITERVEALNLIWRQAHLDSLTELPNRSLFLEKLIQEMQHADQHARRAALLFIDLDRFKDVNDTLGHFMGDILLKDAGRRLKALLSDNVTLARMGGDEFAVIASGIGYAAEIEPLAQKILQCLSHPFQLSGQTVYLSASIGVAFYPEDAGNRDELLKHADQAMYAAKKAGGDRYRFFTLEMLQQAQKRLRLVGELHGALAAAQFEVYYQPVVELASRHIVKAEALLRWHHPELGMVSPADFIPLAEETGLIVEIGEWVFQQAAQQVAVWRQNFHCRFQVSVNKSPVQFGANRYDHQHWPQQLLRMNMPGTCVVVEITEGLLMDANPSVNQQLLAFRDAGIQVALDDFGTGYSSLAYLRKFDIDYLKIDQAFVRNLSAESNDLALCEAIIVMAHKLGIKVIAEGIETEDQYALLMNAGCDYGQGYLFARPLPVAEFESMLQQQAAD